MTYKPANTVINHISTENDRKRTHENHAFQPVRFAILNDVVDSEYRQEEHDGFEWVEEEREWLAEDPTERHDEWDHK